MKKVLLLLFIILISNVYALCEEGQIDINNANITELDKLSGIGPVKAQAIIDARPFTSLDNLIDVTGIGDITLDKIKTQNIACVDEQEEENIQDEEPEEKPETIEVYAEEIKNTTKEETKIIILTPPTTSNPSNPKDIKSEIDKEELNKNKLAIYGLIVFCILLVFLFIFKKRNKEKNEFK